MQSRKRTMDGLVVSAKMKKTIVVQVIRTNRDELYGKSFKAYRKFKAHDEKQEAKEGDLVRIIETRPYSREKHFTLLEVLKK